MKFDKNELCTTCKNGLNAVENAFDKAKDLSLHHKIDVGFEIRSKKQNKNLFDVDFHSDKSCSLLKLIGILAGGLVVLASLSIVVDSFKKPHNQNVTDDNGFLDDED